MCVYVCVCVRCAVAAGAGESLADQRTKLHEALDQFQGIPFTIQRLAELLCDPQTVYRSTHKLVAALDKVAYPSSAACTALHYTNSIRAGTGGLHHHPAVVVAR